MYAIILFLLLIAAASVIWGTLKNGISPMPTSPKVKKDFLHALPKLSPGSIILELGAGWGTLAFPLAAQYPDSHVIAYESSWVPYLFCRLRLIIQPLPNLTIKRTNFFSVSFDNATLVICYLFPGAMRKLKDKFSQELDNKCTIATHTFAIPGWTPYRSTSVDDLYQTKIYLYHPIKA